MAERGLGLVERGFLERRNSLLIVFLGCWAYDPVAQASEGYGVLPSRSRAGDAPQRNLIAWRCAAALGLGPSR